MNGIDTVAFILLIILLIMLFAFAMLIYWLIKAGDQKGVNMNERNCENCKHHTENGCTSWDCEYEPNLKEESEEEE